MEPLKNRTVFNQKEDFIKYFEMFLFISLNIQNGDTFDPTLVLFVRASVIPYMSFVTSLFVTRRCFFR